MCREGPPFLQQVPQRRHSEIGIADFKTAGVRGFMYLFNLDGGGLLKQIPPGVFMIH